MLKSGSPYIYVSLQSYNINTFIVPFTNSDCNIAKNVRTGIVRLTKNGSNCHNPINIALNHGNQ